MFYQITSKEKSITLFFCKGPKQYRTIDVIKIIDGTNNVFSLLCQNDNRSVYPKRVKGGLSVVKSPLLGPSRKHAKAFFISVQYAGGEHRYILLLKCYDPRFTSLITWTVQNGLSIVYFSIRNPWFILGNVQGDVIPHRGKFPILNKFQNFYFQN